MLRTGMAVLLAGIPALAAADEAVLSERDDTLYVEALGKAGPYGLGYERAITSRLGLGIAASYAVIREQHLATVAPYLHIEALRGKRHSLYADIGLVVVHSRIPSPVPEWDGMTDTGAGGQATLGWEARPWRLVVRSSLGVAVGEGGVGPFVGLAVGARW